MLLYVHVPFCTRKCGYCAFHSGRFSREAATEYMQSVLREMQDQARILGPVRLDTVYFGGGTPSLLEPAQIGAVLDAAARCFVLTTGAEITVEANPESALRKGFLDGLRLLGVNRLSLGVQSLHDDLLAMLGRIHDSDQARSAARAARDAGFENLSLDLIWGLPGQDLTRWMQDLAEAVDLEPTHMSCYGLTLEEGTTLTQLVDSGTLVLPDEEEGARMFLMGAEYLESRGFRHYEVSNFAIPGRESRHNSGYWAGRDYLGLGPSAVSTQGHRRWANPADLGAYTTLIVQGGKRDVEILSEDIRLRETIMLALRTSTGLDLEQLKAMAGNDFPPGFRPAVERLRSSGLVRLDSGHLFLTRAGMLVSNSIIELVLDLLDRVHEDTGNL
jgi:oxygen-independent coproporphyrinogen-3 oxidase